MFQIGICDDESIICSEIENIILNYSKLISEKIEVDVFYSGEELYNYLKNDNYFDMIFLDIELKKLNGIELGKIIRNEMKNEITQIVYISSKENYAMELFEVRPLNFLIKPIDDAKVIEMMNKVMELLNKLDFYFKYKQGHNFFRKEIKDIIYFESDNRQVKMVTTTDEIKFYGTLSEIHLQLEPHKFFFIHKSYLVNYYHVAESYYDRLVMTNSQILPISQSKRSEVRKLQLKYERDEI
ncbi:MULTISPECIES: LytR/AlgR family response regulator transcription factor [unclassified Sedimentibacter]|uniref:LytR/AlgR family response regulator transcription factor n=1 Tax=unclassified Sedimentibacter TaxID=2649220 RepID=UPI0027E21560|nr:LytTR family DNA-binding domain-containing protein [Sedimentibacter sp. MB35-C1]WMJ77724.1 LytTR family DNA-binding domain-containing protein [Sedimentibacter sp. MB35-C1]